MFIVKDCTFCQIARLFAISGASACFVALAVLSLINGLAVPLWVIAGFLVSAMVAIWVIAAYLRQRGSVIGVDQKTHEAKR